MARADSYKIDINITSEDSLFGSDLPTRKSRNFPVGAVAEFLGTTKDVRAENFIYTYVNVADYTTLQPGQMSFDNTAPGEILYNNITELYVNDENYNGLDTKAYFESMGTGSFTLTLNSFEDTTNFGVFQIESVNEFATGITRMVLTKQAAAGGVTGGEKMYFKTNYTKISAAVVDTRTWVDSTGNGLVGIQNGVNKVYTTSRTGYTPNSLLVFVSGSPMCAGNGLTEGDPGAGTFTLDVAPESYERIIAQYSN